jgi:ABC-2 type transport system permease protein
MNLRMFSALVMKDLSLYFKNRFFALVTALGLVFYLVVFFLLPATVDETLELGWYAPELPGGITQDLRAEGLLLNEYESDAALQQAVLAGDEPVGISLAEDFVRQLSAGEVPKVAIYFHSSLPDEFRSIYSLLMEELGFILAGQPLNLEVEEVMLGQDMVGQQVPPRQRMLPVLVVFILMIEAWGLASLISTEAETGTLRALLVTPLRVGGLFLSKGATGILMAFSQVAILLAVTGGFRHNPLLMVVVLLLGSLLVTGLSFLIASISRDMMSVLGWGMLAMIVLAIPSFNILLPGLASNWIKIIPSFYMVDSIYRVINFGSGWSQLSGSLLALLAFAVAFFGLGAAAMNRRLA